MHNAEEWEEKKKEQPAYNHYKLKRTVEVHIRGLPSIAWNSVWKPVGGDRIWRILEADPTPYHSRCSVGCAKPDETNKSYTMAASGLGRLGGKPFLGRFGNQQHTEMQADSNWQSCSFKIFQETLPRYEFQLQFGGLCTALGGNTLDLRKTSILFRHLT